MHRYLSSHLVTDLFFARIVILIQEDNSKIENGASNEALFFCVNILYGIYGEIKMNEIFVLKNIAEELNIKEYSVSNTIELFKNDATIPFIARYRKEKTDGLDETQIKNISERFEYYKVLEKRKETILETIKGQEKLTPELEKSIIFCTEKQKLEDIYLPYKPKKRTKAAIAKEKGLEPLANLIFMQLPVKGSKEEILSKYLNAEKGVNDYQDALLGALDIIAEKISDMAYIRSWLRNFVLNNGLVCSKV